MGFWIIGTDHLNATQNPTADTPHVQTTTQTPYYEPPTQNPRRRAPSRATGPDGRG